MTKTVTLEPYWPNMLRWFDKAAWEAETDAKKARGRNRKPAVARAKKLADAREETRRYLAAVWRERFPEVEKMPDVLMMLETPWTKEV